MSRYSVVETSDSGRTEIDYSAMTEAEIARRIRAYNEKYGMTLAAYSKRFSCGSANPHEMAEIMDWDCLIRERSLRAKDRSVLRK